MSPKTGVLTTPLQCLNKRPFFEIIGNETIQRLMDEALSSVPKGIHMLVIYSFNEQQTLYTKQIT